MNAPEKRTVKQRFLQNEDLNFLLTNRIPRIALTCFMGWFSQIENPFVCRASIAVWRFFTPLDLSDAKKQSFTSLHDCFTRELVSGARTVDQEHDVLSSPSDGIVGACGQIEGDTLFQAKGFPYTLQDLFGHSTLAEHYRDGCYVTLRLTSAMYHRFHSPQDCTVNHVTYISGDTWNVNPVALMRIEKLFCKNERALIQTTLDRTNHLVTLVPVAAVLVASIRLHFLNVLLHLKYRGPNEIPCHAQFRKGEEMGWFQHGSTIIVFAPKGFTLFDGIENGSEIRMGQGLMRLPQGC
jgi:phosphatidylserine decarboxylase